MERGEKPGKKNAGEASQLRYNMAAMTTGRVDLIPEKKRSLAPVPPAKQRSNQPTDRPGSERNKEVREELASQEQLGVPANRP